LEKLSFKLIKMFLMPKPTLETSQKTFVDAALKAQSI
jgi:hypothetical protein